MAKKQAQRKVIPTGTKDTVMRVFSHLCAACGARNPQLHHIDLDHNNNDPLNLIPLCPNHHLTDAHDPTRPIEPGILRLLRLYRDPTVLDSRFQPIYRRLEATRKCLGSDADIVDLCIALEDLWLFLQTLKMGEYYSHKFEVCILGQPYKPSVIDKIRERHSWELLQVSLPGRDTGAIMSSVEASVVEMLRYQGWEVPQALP